MVFFERPLGTRLHLTRTGSSKVNRNEKNIRPIVVVVVVVVVTQSTRNGTFLAAGEKSPGGTCAINDVTKIINE